MTSTGSVSAWLADDGWGVIDSADTPGGCWAHYSVLHMSGYRSLSVGDVVQFEWEEADQDGYSYRAVRVHQQDRASSRPDRVRSSGTAYQSTLQITLEDDG